MEMSPNAARSALLPWLLCLAAALTSDLQPMASAPSRGAPNNATLLFDSGAGLRNCSCSAAVRDCDEARANSRCRCHSVLRTALPGPGLGRPGSLTVWVRQPWVLEELLNGSTVAHLRLSLCGAEPLQSRQLVLLGLRTLRVHSAAPGAPYPNQEVRVWAAELDESSSLHMALLDVGALNGRSALKAYSVIGPPLQAFSQFFPHLGFPSAPPSSDAPDEPLESRRNSSEPLRKTFTTFVY